MLERLRRQKMLKDALRKFMLAFCLILLLVVPLYASTLTGWFEVKDNWGENGVTIILIGEPPYTCGIRIDGTLFMLI